MMTETTLHRRWLEITATLALLFGSIALTLLVGEFVIRMVGYQPIHDVYSKPSLFWIHDDTLGWVHQSNSEGTYIGPRPWPIEFETPIRINSQGLRGPEILPKRPNDLRVLVLGDSVVAAFEVPYDKTFVALLERRLADRLARPVRVINAGVRGYGTDQSLLYLQERGIGLSPDVVLFVHSNNDPENNVTLHRMRRPFGKAAFAMSEEDESLELIGKPVPHFPLCSSWIMDDSMQPLRKDGRSMRIACRLQLSVADHSALFTFLALRIRQNPQLLKRLYRLGAPNPQSLLQGPQRGFELTQRLMQEIATTAIAARARVGMIITEQQWDKFDPATLETRGASVHQLLFAVREGADPMAIRFHHDSHYTANGHRLVAEFLEPIVVDLLEKIPEVAPADPTS